MTALLHGKKTYTWRNLRRKRAVQGDGPIHGKSRHLRLDRWGTHCRGAQLSVAYKNVIGARRASCPPSSRRRSHTTTRSIDRRSRSTDRRSRPSWRRSMRDLEIIGPEIGSRRCRAPQKKWLSGLTIASTTPSSTRSSVTATFYSSSPSPSCWLSSSCFSCPAVPPPPMPIWITVLAASFPPVWSSPRVTLLFFTPAVRAVVYMFIALIRT